MQSFFNRPTAMYATPNGPVVQAGSTAYIHQTRIISFDDSRARPLVSTLDSFSCPIAIVWRITEVIVHSFNAMFGCWFRPHVGIEVFKRSPAFTNSDPSTSVVSKSGGVRIVAALLQAVPAFVFTGSCAIRSMAMRFGSPTSATLLSQTQGASNNCNRLTTVALALPLRTSMVLIGRSSQYFQSPIAFAGAIDKGSTWITRNSRRNKSVCRASTTLRVATRQVARRYYDHFAALAFTCPLRMPVNGPFGPAKNEQLSVPLTNSVDKMHGDII